MKRVLPLVFKSKHILMYTLCLCTILFFSCNKDDDAKPNSVSDTTNSYSSEDIFRGLIFSSGAVAQQIPGLKEISDVVLKLNTDPHVNTVRVNYENNLISFIKEYYPGFLDQFKKDVESKDLIRIDSAVSKASDIALKSILLYGVASQIDHSEAKEIVTTALNQNSDKFNLLIQDLQNNKIKPSQIKARASDIFGHVLDNIPLTSNANSLSNESTCIFINLAVAVNLAIYLNGAIAVNIAIAVNGAITVNIALAVNFWVAIPRREGFPSEMPSPLIREQFIAQIAEL